MDRVHLIRVEGTVQGVGFRPTVWRIAQALGLRGSVRNDGAGVLIELFSDDPADFLAVLQRDKPPLARIDRISVTESQGQAPPGFSIIESSETAVTTAIPADAATCPDCLAETLDPSSRRFRYPFTNCTHCGPRLTIITALPYDRRTTTMSGFTMCADCRAEYANPADRRYHAQPIACPVCGPQAWFEADGTRLPGDAVEIAAEWIRDGRIVAVKGLGGFQLACDAANDAAVDALRDRKKRSRKPFALMAGDVAQARTLANVEAAEESILLSSAAPIVLLKRRDAALAANVAPGYDTLGVMLPATPLHHLLMRAVERPIVLTSGNRSDDPQVTGDREAVSTLGQIADGFLMHSRPIAQRVDDSVVRLSNDGPITLRRGRGFAPEPVMLHKSFRDAGSVLGMGGDLKGAVALARNGAITLSQHLGDLATPLSRQAYEETLSLLMSVNGFVPGAVAVDAHPDFHSRREGELIAAKQGARRDVVQHHHAHIAACMAENGLPCDHPPVLGIALDGLGFGSDGTVWGGEFLMCDFTGFRRLAHFAPVPLAGGDLASRQPWRNAYTQLDAALGWDAVVREFGDLDVIRRLTAKALQPLRQMIAQGVNAPACSSAGRLLDACAALLDICFEEQDYEGEAPSRLEALAEAETVTPQPLGFSLSDKRLCWDRLFHGILTGLREGRSRASLAADVHATIAEACAAVAITLAREHDLTHVALSGGCFANARLLMPVSKQLKEAGLSVLIHKHFPPGDGGLAAGQCAVALARLRENNSRVCPMG